MSKAVLISIRHKWCELIASGEKTIEVRKTRPKQEPPFKCYIYCTKPSFPHEDFFVFDAGTDKAKAFYGGGKVIGEYVCNEIQRYARYGLFKEPARYMKSSPGGYPATEIYYSSLQITPDALEQYGKGALLYGWHISNLVIYDEPKKLNDFMRKPCDFAASCGACNHAKWLSGHRFDGCELTVTRPPQSWCYVEELP